MDATVVPVRRVLVLLLFEQGIHPVSKGYRVVNT